MGIFVGKDSRVVVQGITGKQATFHTKIMKDYGSNVVAGVTPGWARFPFSTRSATRYRKRARMCR